MQELRRNGKSFRSLIEADIEILPLMNLFIVLIPMLLLSAVFIEVSVVDMTLPGEASAEELEKPEKEPLSLAVLIGADEYVISGNGLASQRVPRTEDGSHEALLDALRAVKAAHPDEKNVRILSTPKTKYGEIIAVMDVSRDAGLPNAGLAAADTGASGLSEVSG